MSTLLAVKSVGYQQVHGEYGHVAVSTGKVLPASATGNLFTVTGTVLCSLVGVVTTVLSITSVSPTIGITGSPAIIAAAPAAPLASTAVGSLLVMPTLLGGPLPAPVVASEVVVSAVFMEITNTIITITTGATNTGAITWILSYAPLFPKHNASVVVD